MGSIQANAAREILDGLYAGLVGPPSEAVQKYIDELKAQIANDTGPNCYCDAHRTGRDCMCNEF